MKPFLKWLGNKYRHLDKLLNILPQGNRLIEPFAGSCAVFLNTHYDRYLLAEKNADLVALYQCLRTEKEDFIHYCQSLFISKNNQPKAFYKLRERFNQSEDHHERAALFIYLNRHGYNGLCRYNRNGGFNVPFGRHKKPYFPEKEMRGFYQKCRNTRFIHSNYLETLKQARPGDVLYCDPPYVPLSKTANFTTYTYQQFDETDQLNLAKKAKQLANKGMPVLISNHDTKFTRHHYREAELYQFETQRFVSCQGANRQIVKEILALFH